MQKEFYNDKTKTLTIPFYFNEELKYLQHDILIIIFEEDFAKAEYSRFNQLVENLPTNLTYLRFGYYFNQKITNLPSTLTYLAFGKKFNYPIDNLPPNMKQIYINKYQINLLNKIPFECKIIIM